MLETLISDQLFSGVSRRDCTPRKEKRPSQHSRECVIYAMPYDEWHIPFRGQSNLLVGVEEDGVIFPPHPCKSFGARFLKDIPRDTLTSSDVSHVEMESLHVKDQETQADLERLSNLEGSEYSDQAGTALKEMPTGFELTVQIAQYKDDKKQQQNEKMDASRGTPTSSYIPDDMTEGLDDKRQAVHLENRAKREADVLQPEGFTSVGEISNLEELEQPCGRRITTSDLELEKMRWDSALTRLKHKHEDNEKQRQHEKNMEQIRQQATPRSFGQGLHDLLRPQNQYTLFLYCFIFIHLIYTVRELAFYFVIKHYLFCFAIVLCFIFKKIFLDFKNKKKCC